MITAPSPDCLDDAHALAFVEGTLEAGARTAVEDHIDDCAHCRRVIAGMVRGDDVAASASAAWRPGQRVGRYVVREQIGSGGMGRVFRAEDPELGRAVALKRLHAGDRDARARLVREASAAAQLSHPNVVTIHEVGEDGGTPFLAMELVDGITLTQWLRAQPRDWRAVVEVMTQAGRALQAAHARGLVHRDFKPDNVLVDRAARARVVDFGLARTLDVRADGAAATSAGRSMVTTAALAGTPAYLAPELVAGGVPDARSDQYAFAVSLFECVYGCHPFVGGTALELWAGMAAGEVRPPPRTRAPAWLGRAIRRGMQVDPAARWPDLDALLGAIRPRPRRAPIVAGAVAVIAVTAAAVVIASSHGSTPGIAADDCASSAQRLTDAVWGTQPRAAMVARFAQVGATTPQLTTAIATTTAMLDDWAATWRLDRTLACRSEPAQRPARMGCLDHALGELGQQLVAWSTLDRDDVSTAARTVGALPRPDECLDHAPPASAISPALDQAIAALDAKERSGHARDAGPAVAGVVRQAEASRDAETIARATRVAAAVERVLLDLDHARAHAVTSATAAARAGDDAGMVDALVLQATIAVAQLQPRDALSLCDAAAAVVVRSKVERTAQVERVRGDAQSALGDDVAAIAAYQRAIAVLEPRAPRDRSARLQLASTLRELGAAQGEQHHSELAHTSLERALAIEETELGPDHSDVATTVGELALQEMQLLQLDQAQAHLERARAIIIGLDGERSRRSAGIELSLGELTWRRGDCTGARVHWQQARRDITGIVAPTDPYFALIAESIGNCERDQHEPAAAVEDYRQAIAVYEAGTHTAEFGNALIEYGMALADVKRYAEARSQIERGLAELDKDDADPETRVAAWQTLAELEVLDHHRDRALELLHKVIDAIGDDTRADYRDARKEALARIAELNHAR